MAIENNTDYTLKGSQVLALRDYVNAAMNLPGTVIGSGAPTTATEGNVGQFYYDTVNDKFYYCEAKTAQGTTPETYLYTWTLQVSGPTVVQTTGTSTTYVMSQKAVTDALASAGGAKELTTADYDYPVNSPNSIAAWKLDNGWYTAPGCLVRVNSSVGVGFDSGSLFYVKKGSGSGSASRIVVFGLGNEVTVYSTDVGSGSEYSPTTQTVALAGNTGTSTSLVMTQNAVTSMVFADPGTKQRVQIGNGSNASGIGSIALGYGAYAQAKGSIGLGTSSNAVSVGEMNIGTLNTEYGYDSSYYRLLTGLYDPQSAHDAATKGYVDTAVAGAAYDPTISNNTLYL